MYNFSHRLLHRLLIHARDIQIVTEFGFYFVSKKSFLLTLTLFSRRLFQYLRFEWFIDGKYNLCQFYRKDLNVKRMQNRKLHCISIQGEKCEKNWTEIKHSLSRIIIGVGEWKWLLARMSRNETGNCSVVLRNAHKRPYLFVYIFPKAISHIGLTRTYYFHLLILASAEMSQLDVSLCVLVGFLLANCNLQYAVCSIRCTRVRANSWQLN